MSTHDTRFRNYRQQTIVILLVLGVLLVGPSAGGAAPSFKAAAVFPGQINDNSWNAAGFKGLEGIKKELGASIAYAENVAPAIQATALRNFGSKGYNLVFAHGGQYQGAVLEAAAKFPKTHFVTIAGTKGNGSNASAYSVDFAQFHYVLGFVSAKISKSGHIGLVTALQGLKTVTDSVAAFRAAAKKANPSIKTTVVYLKNNEDPAEAKAASEAMLASNVDVLLLAALNAANQGVIQAAKQAGVWTNVEYVNLSSTAPNIIMTNTIYNWTPLYLQAAKAHRAGGLRGGIVNLGFRKDRAVAGGWLEYDATHMFNPRIPDSVVRQATALVNDLATGKIKIPAGTAALAAPGTQ